MLREGSAFSRICLSFCSQVPDPSIRLKCLLLPPATKLGQGNIFTDVCDSGRRGGLPQCMFGYPPPPGTGRHPPPRAEHTGRYGQRAGGMHPNGMQYCFFFCIIGT